MREDCISCKVGDLLTVKNGFAFKSKEYQKEGVPVVRIGDIQEWKVDVENAKRIPNKQEFESYEIKKGDILIAMSGATTGKFGLYASEEKAYQNQRVGNLKPHSDNFVNSTYIYYLLYSLKREIEKEAYGGAQPNISASKIENLDTLLFSLPIQRAIVSKIEELFSSLDSGIADLKKAQEQLKIYRQAVLKKAFEGKWKQEKLEKLSVAMGGYAFKSGDFLSEGEYQVVRIGNVRPGKIKKKTSPVYVNEIDKKIEEKYLLKPNDLVITLTGTRKKRDYGYTALVKENNLLLNQRLAYIRLKEQLLPKFFLYFSWSEPFKVQFFGSETGNVGQGNVGMKSVRETLVPQPPIDEQEKIVQYLENQFSICDQVDADIRTSLNSSQTLRQSILKKAFEGELLSEEEIEKCKKEYDYEPADVLLQKIKAEKKKK